jgi:hypothetical protein
VYVDGAMGRRRRRGRAALELFGGHQETGITRLGGPISRVG